MKITLNLVSLVGVFALMILSSEARGNPAVEIEPYKINGTEVELIHHPNRHLLVSTNCLIKKNNIWIKNENCEAIKKLKHLSLKRIKGSLSGGVNPGAVACLDLGGKSLLALDSKSNQNSVCQFKDRSIASSGTLHYHARQNDRLQKD
jgi:hypothetical protein